MAGETKIQDTDHGEMTENAERQAGLYKPPLSELALLAVHNASTVRPAIRGRRRLPSGARGAE
jgi:hypothetical protein